MYLQIQNYGVEPNQLQDLNMMYILQLIQMGLLLNNESERKRIIEKQQPVIARYDWSNSANDIVQLFTEITNYKN
jgi:hypothetical protein